MSFRPLADHELYELDEERLAAHLAAARAAGDLKQARTAVFMLLYKHESRMRARIALRLPRHLAHHAQAVGDWVVPRVTNSALKLGFRGASAGEWVNWWGVAIDRQVVSFWRTAEGQALERTATDDPDTVARLGEDLDVERLVAQACYADIVQTVLDRMDNEMHAAVVRAAYFEDLPSRNAGERFGTTAANVDKVKQRFREELHEECLRRGVDGT